MMVQVEAVMTTPIEHIASLRIGSVESVSPSQIRVVLELDAPQATALNAGVPTAFPRINNYVLIPNEGSALVGMISWIGVEASNYPKRRGLKDFDLVDLPFPIRRMVITPIGTLVRRRNANDGMPSLKLDRGVNRYPSVGDGVLLASPEEVKAIIESSGADDRVSIGRSALSSDAIVSVDPNKLFGRHLAVLGNTGSGKSCSVSGLIHWSLGRSIEASGGSSCNARFIILDPNGEYGNAFQSLGRPVRRYQVSLTDDDSSSKGNNGWESLCLPAWLWNSHEWCSFASAAPGVQRPLLLQGLRDMRAGKSLEETVHRRAFRLLSSYHAEFSSILVSGPSFYGKFPGTKNTGLLARRLADDAKAYIQQKNDSFERLHEKAVDVAESRDSSYTDRNGEFRENFDPFSETDLGGLLNMLKEVITECKQVLGDETADSQPREDAPIAFDVAQLPDHLKQLAANWKSGNATQFADFLAMRVQMILDDQRLGKIITPNDMPTLASWLEDYVGSNNAENGPVCILDLSLVPADILQMVIAVLSRLVFEAVQRFRRLNGQELPTVLVLEEAHSFVRRARDDDAELGFATNLCRSTFERIAREGRKFGLGLVLSSQRPSEISATVLAQCNTFLLHRLVNDRDQEFVKKLVPEMLGGLLSELPNLPTRQAILLGWATPIPVLVEMKELRDDQKPHSSDPKFWEVWTGAEERKIDWHKIADDWTR